jgi:hypothetical protein
MESMEKVWENQDMTNGFSLVREGVHALCDFGDVKNKIHRSLKAGRELHPFSTKPFACVADNSALRHCIKSFTKLSFFEYDVKLGLMNPQFTNREDQF